MITAIWAEDLRGVIGVNGRLPWKHTADMRNFYRHTVGSTVAMGRKTWESLDVRPLPKRQNIVLSTTMEDERGVTVARSLDELKGLLDASGDAYIIGGAGLFGATLDWCDRLIVTYLNIHAPVPVGSYVTYAPDIPRGFTILNVDVPDVGGNNACRRSDDWLIEFTYINTKGNPSSV